MSTRNLAIRRTESSCAVQEIHGVTYLIQREIEELLDNLKIRTSPENSWGEGTHTILAPETMYFFADRTGARANSGYPGNAKLLVAEIKKRKLGKLWETDEFLNKGNKNKCTAWLWWLDQKSIDNYKKNKDAKTVKAKTGILRRRRVLLRA